MLLWGKKITFLDHDGPLRCLSSYNSVLHHVLFLIVHLYEKESANACVGNTGKCSNEQNPRVNGFFNTSTCHPTRELDGSTMSLHVMPNGVRLVLFQPRANQGNVDELINSLQRAE